MSKPVDEAIDTFRQELAAVSGAPKLLNLLRGQNEALTKAKEELASIKQDREMLREELERVSVAFWRLQRRLKHLKKLLKEDKPVDVSRLLDNFLEIAEQDANLD